MSGSYYSEKELSEMALNQKHRIMKSVAQIGQINVHEFNELISATTHSDVGKALNNARNRILHNDLFKLLANEIEFAEFNKDIAEIENNEAIGFFWDCKIVSIGKIIVKEDEIEMKDVDVRHFSDHGEKVTEVTDLCVDRNKHKEIYEYCLKIKEW